MHNGEISNTNQKSKPWHASSGLALISFFVSLITWIIVSYITAGDLEIKPTQFILRIDACNYLRQIGIHTTNSENGSNCTINVPYRTNSFGSGGMIFVEGERQIRIADNQVVIVGSIENQPWTSSQSHWVMLMVACSIFMLGMMAWFLRLLFTSKS